MRAESPGLGQGATFTVEIPLSVTDPSTDGTTESTAAPADGALSGIKILVVDDEPDARELGKTA